jgi:hypothetical protein
VSDWEVISRQVAVTGCVIDEQTRRPLVGARINITRAPREFTDWLALKAVQYDAEWNTMAERPDQTHTATDGSFYFLDLPLPKGVYNLTAMMPNSSSRYDTGTEKATISRDKIGNVKRVSIDIALPATTIKGSITDKNTDDPVTMAAVQIKGSAERVFSDGRGEYNLTGLETGKRTVLVLAHGYKTASKAVLIKKAGTIQTADFKLEK